MPTIAAGRNYITNLALYPFDENIDFKVNLKGWPLLFITIFILSYHIKLDIRSNTQIT
jgi:hypothetical protein